MKGSADQANALVLVLLSVILIARSADIAHALTVEAVLEKGEEFIHVDLNLAANTTVSSFEITRELFEGDIETWVSMWDDWKNQWEGTHGEWFGRWGEMIGKWGRLSPEMRTEWQQKWSEQWNQTWDPIWAEEWEEWEEWMEDWETKWEELTIDEMEEIPEFIWPSFAECMEAKINEIWHDHMEAETMEVCWDNLDSRLGLEEALGDCLNKTLWNIYNTTDSYAKNLDLLIEVTVETVSIDGAYITNGYFGLALSFDLYGVVTLEETEALVQTQFRYLNVTEEVDGAEFGFSEWEFTPSEAMFIDLSAFSVPLEQWDIEYDRESRTTTFTLVEDIVITTEFGDVRIDPKMNLIVPGQATGRGDIIAFASPSPDDTSLKLAALTAIVAVIAFFAWYFLRKRS